MPLPAELLERMKVCGWTVETVDGAIRVLDDVGDLVGILDAELLAALLDLFGAAPCAEA